VRREAIIAIRLAASHRKAARAATPGAPAVLDGRAADNLLKVAEAASLGVARVALLSLSGLALPPALGRRVARLAGHAESERAVPAIELLGAMPGDGAVPVLTRVLLETTERARAEAAAQGLGKREDAPEVLAGALAAAPDFDRAQLVLALLRPRLRAVDPKTVRKLAATALDRLERDDQRAEPLLHAVRAVNPELAADGLRALGDRLRRARKNERALRVFRLLAASVDARPEDSYALASLELGAGRRDEAFAMLARLLERGFDVGKALKADRSLGPEGRYLVGFHFVERGHPLGEDVLSALAESAGRGKIGKMARAKLKSAGF